MSEKNLLPRVKTFLRAHKADLILVLSLVFISLAALILALTMKTEGDSVEVEIDGRLVATYSLAVDGEYEIGDGNVLTVKGGEAYMSYADCPDKTCVRSHAISKNNESIICLPNRVSVRVVSTEDDGVDLEL